MKIVILEGPDGAGKTTLATTLAVRYQYNFKRCGPPISGLPEIERYTCLIENADASSKRIVFDRLHVGELVYGPIVRGHSQLTLQDLYSLDKQLYIAGGVVVYCLPPYIDCLASFMKKQELEGEYLKLQEQLRQVYNEYCLLARLRGEDCIIWDYRANPTKDMARILSHEFTAKAIRRRM